jgi:hypothetical protein
MKLRNRISVIILLVTCCLFLFSCNKPSYHVYGKDPFPQINLPIFTDAFEVHHVINKPEGSKSVQYKAKITWPAQEIIDFYNSAFNKMGLSKYSKDNYGTGRWEHFIDGTQKGCTEDNRYIETWVDKNHSIRIVLNLDYRGTKKALGVSEVSVVCQINKFYDFTRMNEFDEKLRKINKEQEFYTLIGKYSKSNHELDIEKAMKENPNNAELREFIEILNEYK